MGALDKFHDARRAYMLANGHAPPAIEVHRQFYVALVGEVQPFMKHAGPLFDTPLRLAGVEVLIGEAHGTAK